MSLGIPELLIILVIVVLIFGAGRLAGLGRGLGQAIRGFKEELPASRPRTSGRGATTGTDRARRSRYS